MTTLLILLVFSSNLQASPLARKLGYTDQDRVLLLHADDMGLTPQTNQAVADVLKFGLVKSASIMIPAPAARDAIQNYAYLDLDLGLHLAMTSEWPDYRWTPISKPCDVSSIVSIFSSEGYFYKRREPLYIFGRTHDIQTEIEAQIQEALRLGLKPTHLDSHMAVVFLKKRWAHAYLRMARRYRIPPLIIRWSKHLKDQLPPLIMNFIKKETRRAERAGFHLVDYMVQMEGRNAEERKKFILETLQNLKPGVTFIFMHPSYFEPNAPLPKDVIIERMADAQVMQDPELKTLANELNIKLINWRDIGRIYDWDNVSWPH